jgi:sphinganine-1-phosphate aldolase
VHKKIILHRLISALYFYRISEIADLYIVGKPEMTLIAFASNVVDIFKVNDAMTEKGWSLNALQKPNRY